MTRKKEQKKAATSAARRKEILKSSAGPNANVAAAGSWRPVCFDGHGRLADCMSASEADSIADRHRAETGHMTDKENC